MSLGQVIQANGSNIRAESELNLLKMEESKRIRATNTVATARSKELDSIGGEANESARKAGDVFFQKKSAEAAKTAARWGFFTSLASGVAGVASSGSAFEGVSKALSGGFAALGAYFALVGAGQELELVNTQFGKLSEDAESDQKNVKALDGNPQI